MIQMLVRHRVGDFAKWKSVFDSHRAAQSAARLRIKQVLSNLDDANEIFLLFEVDDVAAARGFVTAPEVPDAQQDSGVLDRPDVYLLGPVSGRT